MHENALRLLFTRGKSWISRGIAWATRGKHEGKTLATHQEIFDGPDHVVGAILETKKVRRVSWEKERARLIRERIEYCVVEYTGDVSPGQMRTIGDAITEMLGPPPWKYSTLDLPLQLFDGMIAKLFGSRRTGFDAIIFRSLGDLWKRGVICSETANRPIIKAKIFPPELKHGAPDDSFDFVAASPKWRIVEQSSRWLPK